MLFQELSSVSPVDLEDDSALLDQLRAGGPMNLPRAREMMERNGVDGLVLGDPINVFHTIGHWPFQGRTRPGSPPNIFVLLNRNPDIPPTLVIPRFYYYFTVVDAGFTTDRPVYLFGDPGDDPRQFFPDRGEAALDAVEIYRHARLEASLAQHGQTDGMGKALALAMRDLGLAKGVVGYDYAAIPGWLDRQDLDVTWRQADDLLRFIRLVKSPLEISLMRRASAVNIGAAHAMMASAREGMSYRELRRRFFTEAAARGGEGATLSVDRISNELADRRLRDGQALMIDAVSRTNHYHGDYGRTLFLGEPSKPLRRAVEAMTVGWEAVRAAVKPGVRYTEVVAIGSEAVRKAGYKYKIAFTPHSVGLMHTDEPIRWTDGVPGKADLVLEKNMIISVDCPVMETGLGGSAHLEDLTLITSDGGEQIHPTAGTALIL